MEIGTYKISELEKDKLPPVAQDAIDQPHLPRICGEKVWESDGTNLIVSLPD